jgi:hypothetical protein
MAQSKMALEIAALRAEIAALKATSAPAAPAASAHIGPSGKPDGRTHACGTCDRMFRGDGLQGGKVTFTTATGGLAWHLRTAHGATGF